ncbi:MAG: hypothetical protein CMO80_24755 [Verrucomicrobiales bacterium]|nr:hypothetical protein [Verrucomicrobiales bacterium]|tara:strand:+ start:478 stop:1872 length:1395 start_codon:yes stop_codon:yes gene_type:complete
MSPGDIMSRREGLIRLGGGFGGLVLGSMVGAADVRRPLHTPKARAVIQLFMHGGPSHMDLLDPKPMLNKFHGQSPPDEVSDDERRTTYLLGTPFEFSRHGQSGVEFSYPMRCVAQHADDIAVIRSMFTEHRNHEQAIWMANTGLIRPGRPNIGSWVAYALGSENRELPAYVALPDPKGLPVDGIRNWSNGWLPPLYQGTAFSSEGMPVLHLQPNQARSPEVEAARMELLGKLNAAHKKARPGELELDARIANFELAARMQLSATDALDLSRESEATQKLYGLDEEKTRPYGRRCLMARRLIERGVRFVQIFMRGQPWDTHAKNVAGTRNCCAQTDLPVAGLLTDLKQRGLFDSTIVQWGGEFGRTPTAEQRPGNKTQGTEGRDHHPYGFSIWLAGGGIKGGQTYGATDDFGHRSVVDRVQMADLHATLLHLLGLNHERLTYPHNGRDERLTDVYEAQVLKRLLA